MSLGQVLVAGSFALDQIRHGVKTEAVDAQVEPEIENGQHLADDGRVVVVEIGLMMKEAVPVVGLGHRIPRPVGSLGVDEDDAHVAIRGV